MNELFEILKLILPAAIVFLTAFYIIKKFLEDEGRKRMLELKKMNQKTITPLRLQAYERVVLLLERINPSSMVLKVNRKGMSAERLHAEMLQIIRTEFDHNLSQQLYMSDKAWEQIVTAKEEVIRIINIAFTKMKKDSMGSDLGQEIIGICAQLGKLPTTHAIRYIKKKVPTKFKI